MPTTTTTLTGMPSPAPRRDGSPKVVAKALRILDLFSPERPAWTATEIARALELAVPTAHRLVATLQHHAYLTRGERNTYRLGVAAQDLGARATASMDLRVSLRPMLQQLAEDSGETVLLSICDERRRLAQCVDRIETGQALRLSIDVGRLTPLNAGASSKALLTHLDVATIDAVLAAPLPKCTEGTITDPARLRDELALIRETRYAYSYEETDIGAWGISAPILSAEGRLVASLGIAAPTPRHSPKTRSRMTEIVLATTEAASEALDPRRSRE